MVDAEVLAADAMTRNSRTPLPNTSRRLPSLAGTAAIALLLALLMILAPMGMVATAGHQDDEDEDQAENEDDDDQGASNQTTEPNQANGQECRESGYNMQCNEFGTIRMETTKDVVGEHVETTTYINLATDFEEENARWVMFNLRNTTPGGSPVEIQVDAFETNRSGEIITTREIQDEPNEIELWVDTLDLPVNEEIRLEATIAVTELGAYQLETAVIPFDRAYDPIRTAQGDEVSLFSYTMLGVNDPSPSLGADPGGGDQGWMSTAQEIPTLGPALAASLIGAIALAARRRRQ